MKESQNDLLLHQQTYNQQKVTTESAVMYQKKKNKPPWI